MISDFNYQSNFLLFFFLQGLIFAFLLLKKGIEHENQASKWLSLFIFLCCLYIAPWMLGHLNWYAMDGYREFLFFVPFQQFFLIGPVILIYTKSLLDPSFRLSRKDWLHFVPAFLYLLYSLVIFIVDQLILDEYYFYADGRDKDLAPWYQISGLASIIIYTSLSIRHYNHYRRLIFQKLSYADTVSFNWVKKYLLALLIIVSLRILFLVLYPEWGDFGKKWWYYFFFACLYYYIALAGYTNTVESIVPSRTSVFRTNMDIPSNSAIEIVHESPPTNNNLNLDEWKSKVRILMEEEQLYKNPTLTLTDVASALDTTSKQISVTINQGFEMNFNDFINHYRVEAVKERFGKKEHETHTILSIALSCGFNSKTTFNRVFKRNTSLTPIQYLSQLGPKDHSL